MNVTSEILDVVVVVDDTKEVKVELEGEIRNDAVVAEDELMK